MLRWPLEIAYRSLTKEGRHFVGPITGWNTKELSGQWGVEAVEELSIHLEGRQWRKVGARFSGRIKAKVELICSVTTDPYWFQVETGINRSYMPGKDMVGATSPQPGREIEIDIEADDPPEVFDGSQIDLSPMISEEVVLALPLHPRKPGVQYEAGSEVGAEFENPADPGSKNPFANLDALIRK